MALSREKIEFGTIRKLFHAAAAGGRHKEMKRGINRRVRYAAKRITEDSPTQIKKPYRGWEY